MMCVVASAPISQPATCEGCQNCPKLASEPAFLTAPHVEAPEHRTAPSGPETRSARSTLQSREIVARLAPAAVLRVLWAIGLSTMLPAGAFGEPAKGLEGRHHGW